MTLRAEINSSQLSDLVKQVQAGHEVLLTQDSELVARLIPVGAALETPPLPLHIWSLQGHRVLKPDLNHAEIAAEMFDDK